VPIALHPSAEISANPVGGRLLHPWQSFEFPVAPPSQYRAPHTRQEASIVARLTVRAASPLALASLLACVDHPIAAIELEPSAEGTFAIARTPNRAIDILLVIDDSSSMVEEQAILSASFERFIGVLERPEVQADYRIGIITTDDGNPWCSGTGAEAGALRLSSCRSRPSEFVCSIDEGAGATSIDVTEEACHARCPEQWTNIEIQPTPIDGETEARPRSWLESIAGRTNLPPGLSTVQALQCLGPQGVGGCRFESPLESMGKALQRMQAPDDPDFGFIRARADLLIVFVTDEDDCSYNRAYESIFLPEGNRVFWSDQAAASPTSAVCWNAGVACDGGECRSVNLDVDGHEVADEDAERDAVLRPVSRYIELVQRLKREKEAIPYSGTVFVGLIGGVNSDGSVTYQPSLMDPEYQADFGIGPGCQSDMGRAMPPVRLRELAEAFRWGDHRNMVSICEYEYERSLEPFAEGLFISSEWSLRPSCVPACVADTDRTTPEVVDPSCTLLQTMPLWDGSLEETSVPPCEPDESLPTDHDVCYVTRVGDALDDGCADAGYNVEFELLRREGVAVPGGTWVTATCELSPSQAIDCPDLP